MSIKELERTDLIDGEPIPEDVGGFQTVQGITLVESTAFCERIDWNGGRWYGLIPGKDEKVTWEERGWKPSVTTIIDQGLPKGIGFTMAAANYPNWEHARESWDGLAYDGTMVHALSKLMILGVDVKVEDGWFDPEKRVFIPIEKRHVKRLIGFKRFWDELNPQVHATEILLYSDEIKWAGTADLICLIDGVRWLIDIKTGKEYPDAHQRQLIAYKDLWDFEFPDEPIEKIGSLYLPDKWRKEERSYKLKEYKFDQAIWDNTYRQWLDLNPKIPVEPVELPTMFSLKETEDAEVGD